MKILLLFLFLLLGYLLGSINPAIILSKIKGKDIRSMGSGNAGATNTLRNYGKKAALCVTAGDILKCVISVLAAWGIANIFKTDVLSAKLLAAAGCVLGHNFPIYFGFKGGKGVLVSVTALFMADWRIGAAALLVFIIAFALTRYVSLGSLLGAAAAIIASFFVNNIYITVFTLFAGILTILRHRTNIERLLKGTESKTTFSKRKE